MCLRLAQYYFCIQLKYSLFIHLYCVLISVGTPPSTEVPAGTYPFMVQSDDGRQVPVVQAYAFGKYLGFLKVTFDSNGNVVKSSGNPILLNNSIQPGRRTVNMETNQRIESTWQVNKAYRTTGFWKIKSHLCSRETVFSGQI